MDTFSSAASAFKVPPLPQTNREFYYQFKRTPYANPNRAAQPHVASSTTSIPNNLLPKTKRSSSSSSLPFSNCSSKASSSPPNLRQQQQRPSSPIFHTSPATGYAAAVIDVAQSTNSLHMVHKDVQRILRFLKSDFVEELIKGQVIRQVVQEQGKFHRHVVTLLKMLLKKNKMGIVNQVLQEFERIYDELCGTQVVLVSSSVTKIGEDELFEIAKRVQQLSGAGRVKLLRNMIQPHHT